MLNGESAREQRGTVAFAFLISQCKGVQNFFPVPRQQSGQGTPLQLTGAEVVGAGRALLAPLLQAVAVAAGASWSLGPISAQT